VVIKEFLFKYTGTDVFEGDVTDFDLPAQYNTTVEKFVTPELVYSNPGDYQYLNTDPIWQTAPYRAWYENYGLSITGVNDYQITTTASYIALNSTAFAVDNANGFPVNGVIQVNNELIGYSSVDRATSIISGLTRGVNGTTIVTHLPNTIIYIDLPAVLLLDGGRGYSDPPKVVAYIDPVLYPAPTRPAILKAVMSLDSVLRIDVIDPGQGYAVLPSIIIDPSILLKFDSTDVSVSSNTISLTSPLLQTGDLIRYVVGSNTVAVGGLLNGQSYYVNVLESAPSFVIALYSKYTDAVSDSNRVSLLTRGSGSNNLIYVSARASCVSTAIPVRENQMTLRFDRTTYESPVTDWVTGEFYGSFFAGFLNDYTKLSSSSIALQSTQPPIDNILASAQGATFQISGTSSIDTLTWSSRTRMVTNTYTGSNVIRIMPAVDGAPVSEDQPIGSTIGFYIGMPVKFAGYVSGTGLANDVTYYVQSLVDLNIVTTFAGSFILGESYTIESVGTTNFMTIGAASNTVGVVFTATGLGTGTGTAYTGATNLVPLGFTLMDAPIAGITITIPANFKVGTAGLNCLIGQTTSTAVVSIDYPGILQATQTTAVVNHVYSPLNSNSRGGTAGFYVGIPIFFVGDVFGGIIENETYYVTTVVDDETFTMSKTTNPVMIEVTATTTGTDRITCNNTLSLAINDPVIFTGTVFGGLVAGTTYYVSYVGGPLFSVSSVVNGGNFPLSSYAGPNTMTVTNQKDTFNLTTASGAMTMNVGLPVSPGQITGQLFTFYPTEGIVAYSVSGTDGNLLPIIMTNALAAGGYFSISSVGGLATIYVGMPIKMGATAFGGLSANISYTVETLGTITAEVIHTDAAGLQTLPNGTDGFYEHMPIVFSGFVLGGVELGTQYFVQTVIDSEHFTISKVDPGGPTFIPTVSNGSMMATGEFYVTFEGVTASDEYSTIGIPATQTPTGPHPIFNVGVMLGGYYVDIISPGAGYTFNNTITILGSLLGGIDGTNDLVMTVSMIDARVANPNPILIPLESAGTITSTICAGTPNEVTSQYYLKVVSATDCEVYYNSLMTIPVAGVDFIYNILSNPGGYKHGDYTFLPEPFYFDQSIVRFNHQLYKCIISNNDHEFIFGKWELLTSGAREINALDRIIGYYQPTVNMPGLDITQLVSGVTYPNSTYLGNAFAPVEEFDVDTLLQDKPFYPTEINITAVAWDGVNFVAAANTPSYSVVLTSKTGIDWVIQKISDQPINPTDTVFTGNNYVISTRNRATPILLSPDGVVWTVSLNVPAVSLNSVAYLNGRYVAAGDVIVTSADGYTWGETFSFPSNGLVNILKCAASISLPYYTGFIVVGLGQHYVFPVGGIPYADDNSLLLWSNDGINWNTLTPAMTDGSLNSACQSNDKIIVVGDNGAKFTSANSVTWADVSSGTNNLLDVTYSLSLSMLVAVGESGVVETSSDDGSTWTAQTSGTAENLYGIVWNATDSNFVIVGDNNTILMSSNGTTWTSSSVFISDPTVYDVQGETFMTGYGPEELVPGVINDNLTMLVTTRPGTNWPATEYGHVGYEVVSTELSPTSGLQTIYSFDNLITIPMQITVCVINRLTGLSTTIYQPAYSVDWVAKTITLVTPLTFISPGNSDRLRIDVYSAGNGDQLVKSNTQTDPIVIDPITGFNEIELNCNYSASIFAGSGVIRPGSAPVDVTATETHATTNTIQCDTVSNFSLNDSITFQGVVFGGVVPGTSYFVKTISYITSMITISETLPSGIAGPTFDLLEDIGTMQVITQVGSGAVWTDPIVYHNGDKLIIGSTNLATATRSGTNTIECNSNAGIYVNDSIVFDSRIFTGCGITPHQVYYVSSLVGVNRFTISATLGGPVLPLNPGAGVSTFITHDYAFDISTNGTSASLIFAGFHDTSTMYITFTAFGETTPQQYGYTIPETKVFTVQNTESAFQMTNYVGEDNPRNAVVEYNGLRLVESGDYVLNPTTNTLTLTFTPVTGSTVAVTSYNITDRQYLHTVYGGPFSGSTATILVVSDTTHVEGLFDQNSPVVQTFDQDTPSIVLFDEYLDWLTLSSGSTSSLHINDAITFDAPTFGGIVAGNIYYVVGILSSTEFTVSTTVGGVPVTLTTASGSMTTSVNPATVANIVSVNNAITPPVAVTNVVSTTISTNLITCANTAGFATGQQIQFKASIFNASALVATHTYQIVDLGTTDWSVVTGFATTYKVGDILSNIVSAGTGTGTALLASFGRISTLGVVYFVYQVLSPLTFTIKDVDGNIVVLSTDSGLVIGYVGGNPAVTITTGFPHSLVENNMVRIGGTSGSTQLNNQLFYAKIINSTQLSLYLTPYNPALTAINSPVTTISSYTGGGYIWLDGTFTLITTNATATVGTSGQITVQSTAELVIGTPVVFTGTLFGGVEAGKVYYILTVSSSTFTVSDTYLGTVVPLSDDAGFMHVTQWVQTDVDRVWVTVNGYRVPSSSLYLNADNNLSILTTIIPGDVVIITSMMPTATPNQVVYMENVNKNGAGSVYRANNQTRTWITETLTDVDSVIHVNDVVRLTNTVVQNVVAPAAVAGVISIGLAVDKRLISNITVYNNTTDTLVLPANYSEVNVNLSPILKITAQVTAGDHLTITTLEGNLLYVNGEQIRFSSVNLINHTISGLQRGANGTGIRTLTPMFSEIYSMLSKNRMSDVLYGTTWSSNDYPDPDVDNDIDGGPLQVSTTEGALFLLTGVNQ
jgi:photosystem II stability/assembly factor-like uncharacterized protein